MTATGTTKGQRILESRAASGDYRHRFMPCYGRDFLMDRLGTTASKTIVSDVAIGILGALAVYFLLSSRRERQDFESAKVRTILIRNSTRSRGPRSGRDFGVV
ncbi:MAG TPA: hypothetical protein VJ255_15320 [Candidatus Acidoferrum sp.]|nr:hypothetical protein [Candidatus Acidoferrum sp.]